MKYNIFYLMNIEMHFENTIHLASYPGSKASSLGIYEANKHYTYSQDIHTHISAFTIIHTVF